MSIKYFKIKLNMKKISFVIILLSILARYDCVHSQKTSSGKEHNMAGKVIYEIFVQSFYDTNGDSIGDLKGITMKLDYLKYLSIDGIWLMPIHPSPSYHKYNVTNYYDIHPDYGTKEDFRHLVEEAHKRGILVLIDLVANHTSSEHPWFINASSSKDNPYRNYYVWTDDTIMVKKYPNQVNLGSWYKIRNNSILSDVYYYARFGRRTPDLNYDESAVREEMIKIGEYWITEFGVDGYRFDAAKHIYPTNDLNKIKRNEGHKKNHMWWRQFRNEMDKKHPSVYLVGEIWDNDEIIGPYLDDGLHAAFNFKFSRMLSNSLIQEENKGLIDSLLCIHNTYNKYSKYYTDAIFLKNHDQTRIRTNLKSIKKARLASSILLTLPGTIYLYYGEEIGMTGDKPGINIREPMLWDDPGKDKGQTAWMKSKYSIPGIVEPVIDQIRDKNSLLNHYKELIALRKQYIQLQKGKLEKLDTGFPEILLYTLTLDSAKLTIIHNLSLKNKEISIIVYSYENIVWSDGKISFDKNRLSLSGLSSIVLI